MSLEPELLALMIDTVTVEPFSTASGAGSSSYSAAKNWHCRVQEGNKLVRDKEGREVVSTTELLLAPTSDDGTLTAIGPNDRITLPAGYAVRQPPIIALGRANDEDGVHHWKVNL